MGKNFVFVCFRFCFFVFHAKTAPKKNHRRELSDLSYKNFGNCYSNDIKKLRKSFTGVEKNRFQIFNFHFTRLKLVFGDF